jgi:hypothetical protein
MVGPPPNHIPADGRFGDREAEYLRFAMNPRCAPQRILAAHAANQCTKLRVDPGDGHRGCGTASASRLETRDDASAATFPAAR